LEAERAKWRKSLGVIDAHAHIDARSIEAAIARMDANGVAMTVELTPGSTVEEFAAAKKMFDEKGQGRFLLYVNDPYWTVPVEDPEFGAKMAAIVEGCAKLGARGLKISKSLGLTWKDKDGKIVPIDDPRLDPMWAACGKAGIPVSIHSGDPKAFWQPVDEKNERYDELKDHPNWAFGGGKFPAWEEILAQHERMVAKHPDVRFIGVHFGNIPENVERVGALMRRRANYHIDLAARVPEIGRQDPEKVRAMFIEFQDRILFGTDFMVFPSGYILGAGPRITDEGEVKKFFDSQWRYLETRGRDMEHPTPIQGRWKIHGIGLPRDVLEKIYVRNAERVILRKS
jgi:predicted TIM-barrel fold metal-dependent hydrolase